MRMLVIGTNVTNDILKIAIYPTLSPNLEELFYKQEALPSVITACDNLYQKKWPLKSSIRKQVTHYFEQFYSIEAFTHHIEMEILRKKSITQNYAFPWNSNFLSLCGRKSASIMCPMRKAICFWSLYQSHTQKKSFPLRCSCMLACSSKPPLV